MNERIFELAKQADLIQWDSLPSGARTPDHESVVKARKFAELIVRECMKVCKKTEQCEVGNQDPDEVGHIRAGAVFCREDIKEHFGVEE